MKRDIMRILADWNVWWEKNEVPPNLLGQKRGISDELIDLMELKEIKIITGVRRSGKSTILYQIIEHLLNTGVPSKNILLLNFEDAALAHYSPEEIYESYLSELNPSFDNFVFIDEVQRKEGWENWIRKKYDLKHATNFYVTGSSASLLRKEYATLLTGRNISEEIFPMSFREFLGFSGIRVDNTEIISTETRSKVLFGLKKYLEWGGFPEVFFTNENYKRRLLNQYFEDIIYKDIVDRYGTNSVKTKELGVYLLTNIANSLSMRNVRNALGFGLETISDYMSYMVEAYLLYAVPIYSPSLKIQSANPKKIYCIDSGLRNAVSFKFSDDIGRLAENAVFVELKRHKREVYYWKNNIGEVDFIVKEELQPVEAIQVCWNLDYERTKKREIGALCSAMKDLDLDRGIIITEDMEAVEETDGKQIYFIPVWKWFLNQRE
ncbi:MAG: AAA family ATPase [Methanosarcinales archaeon]|uniref:AAA family ATPase n=1 Tax=Candidatus Ethanoperedens thermophilum TaxID=2766897 RepID=A0A848D908_9EURY|nr:AAA family ATPase [Candidatus Ethanoperedens thermophilum]